jgi:hypothetical protein
LGNGWVKKLQPELKAAVVKGILLAKVEEKEVVVVAESTIAVVLEIVIGEVLLPEIGTMILLEADHLHILLPLPLLGEIAIARVKHARPTNLVVTFARKETALIL